MATVFGAVAAVYVDDVCIIEPARATESAFGTFKTVCKISGSQLESTKEKTPSKIPMLLGAGISLLNKWITSKLPDRKRNDMINELIQTIRNGTHAPAQAGKLRGGLCYSQPLMFRLLGRALLEPLVTRQYSKNLGRVHPKWRFKGVY